MRKVFYILSVLLVVACSSTRSIKNVPEIKNVNATRKMMVYVKLEEAQEKTLFSPSFSDGKSHRNTMKSSSFVIFALLSPCCGLGRKEKSSDLLQTDLAALGGGGGEGPLGGLAWGH